MSQQHISPTPPSPQSRYQVAPWADASAPDTRTVELGYHRLALADPKHRWWKPLVEAAIGVPLYFLMAMPLLAVVMFPLLVESLQASGGMVNAVSTEEQMAAVQSTALQDPLVFAVFFGSVALMFPALWVARLCMGPRPWGLIHSVAGRMRWGWLALCFTLAALMMVIPLGLDVLLGTGAVGLLFATPPIQGGTLVIMLVLIALIVPFQAYAEELVFRGYLIQTVGRWLKHPAWAIILPAPLFMLGHMYDLWAQLSILVMGLAAGYITWRTGGLEAAIALHVANNLFAMVLGVFAAADPFVQGGSDWMMFTSSVISNGIFVLLVLWAAQKRGIRRTRTVHLPA